MWHKICAAGGLSMPIAINRDRFRGIEPGIQGEFLWASSPLEDVQNGCAARCGGDLHKSAKHHMAKRVIAARRPCAKPGTSDIAQGTWSRAQRRWRRCSCDGLCERRIHDLSRFGIRRHLWWRVCAFSQRCTKASLRPRGITASLAGGHTASRGHERQAAPRS